LKFFSGKFRMRTTTQYRGWTIEIHSSRHKHFVKGTTFSASASMVPKTAFDELHRAGADQPDRVMKAAHVATGLTEQ